MTNTDRFRIRVWNKVAKQLYEPPLAVLQYYLEEMADSFVLMQCTGLKDSEGALIWEGDILTFIPEEGSPPGGGTSWVRLELAFDDSYADYYFVNSPDWIKDNSFFAMLEHCNYYRVEGNVYQNPELLEVKG